MRVAGKKYLIYALHDPRSNTIRYIGLSSRGESRPKSHLEPNACMRGGRRLKCWLKSIFNAGLKPYYTILGNFDTFQECAQAEIEFIKKYNNLVNHSTGGEAPGLGVTVSVDTRKKISEATKRQWKSLEGKNRQARIDKCRAGVNKEKQRLSAKYRYLSDKVTQDNLKKGRLIGTQLAKSKSKPVIATSITDGQILEFESLNEAIRYGFHGQCMLDILNKKLNHKKKIKRKQHKGYTFSWGGFTN